MTVHRTLAFAVALSVLPAPSPQRQSQAPIAIDDAETYAVYAAVVRMSAGDKAVSSFAILQETVSGPMDCPFDGPDKREWRSALADFRKQNSRTRLIRPGFALGAPYSVVPMSELTRLMREAGHMTKPLRLSNGLGGDVFRRFPGGRLIALSAVGFNPEKTRAVVVMQYDCFPPVGRLSTCHEGQAVTLSKTNGQWAVAGGVCGWIA